MAAFQRKRIEGIDALRAFALFGIIAVHISSMYVFMDTHGNDFSYFTHLGQTVQRAVTFLFDDKCRMIFSILFGISFYLILRNPTYTLRKFCWRCVLLMGFGLVNKLFSTFDILFWYGLNGLLLTALPVRRWSPKVLLALSLVLYGMSFIDYGPIIALIMPEPSMRYAADTTLWALVSWPWSDILWQDFVARIMIDNTQTLACFVLGYSLGKGGFVERLEQLASARVVVASLMMFTVLLFIYRQGGYHPMLWRLSVPFGAVAYSLLVVFLFCRMKHRLHPMAAYGKLGLTHYSSQNIVGPLFVLWVALPMRWSIEYVYIVGMAFYLVQMAFSVIWEHYYKYGPLEYLWRMATNRQIVSNRKTA